MNTSQFTDKQIMDLSNSQSNNHDDFIDLMNTSQGHHHVGGGSGGGGGISKEEIFPSYDFQPIRPVKTLSPPASFDSGNVNVAGARSWNSVDSKANSSPIRNYGSLDSLEPAKAILGKDRNSVDTSLVSEIDRTMKKYSDNMLHALEGVSARLSQLETRSRQLENSVDDLKVIVGNNHGSTDGKIRHLENILREVQTVVQVIKDKQEIMDAQLQLAKLQVSKAEKQSDAQTTESVDSLEAAASASLHQQLPPVSHPHPNVALPSPNAPLPPTTQQNLAQHMHLHNQFASVPQPESYFSQSVQTPEHPGQQYQMPPPPQMQPSSQPPPLQHFQAPTQPQYSQTPPLPQQPPSSQPQPPMGKHMEEVQYMQPKSYPPGVPQPPPHHQPPPAQHFYGGSLPNMYEPQSTRPGSGFPGASYTPSSAPVDSYPYSSSTSQYGPVGSPVKSQQLSAPSMGQPGGTGYPQLPTAKILPQALPTASPVGGGSGSGNANRVPIDDVVDKVTNMGFPRDYVRATVRRLTENGQSVDLNVVLDKLMNDGDGQPPRGWFGR